jgi:hypothetical protein
VVRIMGRALFYETHRFLKVLVGLAELDPPYGSTLIFIAGWAVGFVLRGGAFFKKEEMMAPLGGNHSDTAWRANSW